MKNPEPFFPTRLPSYLPTRLLLGTASLLLLTASVTLVATREERAKRTERAPPATVVVDAAQGHSFRNHVIPVLTKAGCNSGACHGAAAGKNGFSLTLRGYDPEADYEAL